MLECEEHTYVKITLKLNSLINYELRFTSDWWQLEIKVNCGTGIFAHILRRILHAYFFRLSDSHSIIPQSSEYRYLGKLNTYRKYGTICVQKHIRLCWAHKYEYKMYILCECHICVCRTYLSTIPTYVTYELSKWARRHCDVWLLFHREEPRLFDL